MKTPLFNWRLLGFVVLAGGISGCGEKPAVDSQKAPPASSESNQAGGAHVPGANSEEGTLLVGKGGGQITQKSSKFPKGSPVLLPDGKQTGRIPGEWEGRTPEAEEERLRKSGEWEARKNLFFEQWAIVDPVAAIAASRQTDRGGITVATAAAVTGWAAADLQGAMAWVARQPANAEHAAFVAAVLRTATSAEKGGTNRQAMAEWLGPQTALPSVGPVVQQFVREWAGTDFEKAAAWAVAEIRDAASRSSILDEVVQDAAASGKDGMARTASWIESRPPGLERDELLVSFVRLSARQDPGTAGKWASLIEDGILRQRAEAICRASRSAAQ